MKLSELQTGERGVIVKVSGHGSFRKRIIEMGFVKGNKVKVIDMFTKKQKFLPPEEWVMFKDETGQIVPASAKSFGSKPMWFYASAVKM